MPQQARDTERSRVYAAEVDAFTDTLVDMSIGLEGITTLGGILFADPWWSACTNGVVPRVTAARRDARRSVAASNGHLRWTIRIAPRHDQAPTLSHEAAHVLCGYVAQLPEGFGDNRRLSGNNVSALAAHGPEFRAAHLAVTTVLMGVHGAGLLAAGYRSAGLVVPTSTPWPPPPTTDDEHGIFGRWRNAFSL